MVVGAAWAEAMADRAIAAAMSVLVMVKVDFVDSSYPGGHIA